MRALGADDRGLQLERTILAWRRTTLTAACVALLAVRACIVQPAVAWPATAVLYGLVGCGLAVGAWMRTRDLQRASSELHPAPRLFVLSIGATSAAGGLCVLLSLS